MADNRFPGLGFDARFPSIGADARFPSPGVDTRFPSPGTDTRFSGATYGTRRNMLPNTTTRGAIIPGTLPAEWNVNSAGGLATAVTAIGYDPAGLPAVSLNISGTPSAAAYNIRFGDSAAVPAAQGQDWCGSFYAELLAGGTGLTNISVAQVFINEENSSNVSTGTNLTAFTLGARVRAVGPRVLAGATTAGVEVLIRLGLTIGQPVNVNIRLSGPQLERGSTATDVQIIA